MDLWWGKFNDLDTGAEEYGIDPLLINLIGNICVESGVTFPSDFGCHVPHFNNWLHFTAESWSMWALHYAPYLLHRRFQKSRYYTHFVRLIKILKEVMDYEIQCTKLPRICTEIIEWVVEFKQLVPINY